MKIVADDKIPFLKGVLEPYADVIYIPGDRISNASLASADALLTRSITSCNEPLLNNTPVRFIGTATIGDDHFDKNYLDAQGIQWSTAKGCNADAVTQYIIAALLSMAEKLKITLADSTLGIIGVGSIGSRVKRAAEVLGMQVLCNDPPRERSEGPDAFIPLSEIQLASDFLSLHVPLTFEGVDKTFQLVDKLFLNGFAKSIVMINTSRGGVVDPEALMPSICESKTRGMVLDVWENEPNVDADLVSRADIATPHIAGYSLEGKAMGTAMTIRALSRFFNLGLDSWYPEVEMLRSELEFDCAGLTDQQVLSRVIQRVYPIQEDSDLLKNSPAGFEDLRRNYTFRRENTAYVLNLENCNSKVSKQLNGLGFPINKLNN